MGKYSISVREFVERAKGASIDRTGFVEELEKELRALNKKFSFLREIDIQRTPGLEGPLFGLPVSAKDNIIVKGYSATAGSRVLEGYIPPFDSTVAARAKESGAMFVGKTNQDEFGFGTFGTNSAYQVPKNPLDPERVCGGSSSGAAGLTQALDIPSVALGQSTGGSISCPAAWCSVVGLTPTYGLVSRFGLIDYANSLDKIGPIGKSVFDVALMLSVIAGHDPRDSTSLSQPRRDYTKFADRKELHGMKIGIPKEYFQGLDAKVEKETEKAIGVLEDLGAKTVKVSLPNTKYAISAYYLIATAEASTNLAKYCGMRYGLHSDLTGTFNEYFSKVRSKGFGQEAKRRVMLGTFARMSGYRDAYYLKAMKVRTLIINDFKKAFGKADALVSPTMPIMPPKFTETKSLTPLQEYSMDVLTVPPNLAGIPHISVPVKAKTPIGLHILGDHLQEARIIETAAAFENEVMKK